MAEYKLSFTAKEIDDKLGKVSQLSENVGSLQTDVGGLQTDIQDKAEIMMLTSAEYEALDQIDDKTLYMLTDEEEDSNVPTNEEALEIMMELEMFTPMADGQTILTDEKNNILVI